MAAEDLVQHFENRVLSRVVQGMAGKAMVVCMSRWICIALYDELIKSGAATTRVASSRS